MKESYIVTEEVTLLEYLYQVCHQSKKTIKQYLSHGGIYVNNKKVSQYNYPLKQGMVVEVWKKKVDSLLFDILYEDEYIIVVNKPSGLLTIASSQEKEHTLYHYVSQYLRKQQKTAKVFIVHRLDKDTSGIVLFAKDSKTKNRLQQHWEEYVKLREYKAIVEGVPKQKEARLIHYLKETKTRLVYVAKEGKKAITSYRLEKSQNGLSELTIWIETGRKNQIRVQLAHVHLPILGDKKYQKRTTGKRLYLHATCLKMFYPMKNKMMVFTSEVPIDFKKVMEKK